MIGSYSHFEEKYSDFLNNGFFNQNEAERKRISQRCFDIFSNPVERKKFINEFESDKNIYTKLDGLKYKIIEAKELVLFFYDIDCFDFSILSNIPQFTIYFDNCIFDHTSYLHKGNNFSDLSFYRCEFRQKIIVDDVNGEHNFYFYACKFYSLISFESCTFESSVSFYTCDFFEKLNVKQCEANDLFILESATFHSYLPDLRGSIFKFPLELDSIIFEDENILEQIKPHDEKEKLNIASSIRYLRKFAKSSEDYRNEIRLYSIENEAVIGIRIDSFDYSLSRAFRAISNYGTDYKFPFIIGLILLIPFYLMNLSFVKNHNSQCDGIHSCVFVSTINNALPIGFSYALPTLKKVNSLYSEEKEPVPSPVQQFFQMFQKLIYNILWFLILLGIRNQFKIR